MDVPDTVRRMDLNLIVPLNALLEQRHVTRAAESVGIGQSAMSAALGGCGGCSTTRCWSAAGGCTS